MNQETQEMLRAAEDAVTRLVEQCVRTGTLYTLLQRLLEEQLIGEMASTPTSAQGATAGKPADPATNEPAGPAARADSRRRYYRLTAAGTKTLARQRGLWEQFVNGLERVARFRPA